ncbi:hypothetical protein ABRY59_11055 [Ralstonia pseudosolanacearum]|nr:hypothetical protein [Ralstonia pseudosolanacearum]
MSREQSHDAAQRPHLTQRDLAIRWGRAESTIARYRSDGVGPRFLKIGGAVLYRLEDIEHFGRSGAFLHSLGQEWTPASLWVYRRQTRGQHRSAIRKVKLFL